MGKSYVKEWETFFEEVVDLFLADAFKVNSYLTFHKN